MLYSFLYSFFFSSILEFIMSLEITKTVIQLIPSDSIDEIKRLLITCNRKQRFIISSDVRGSSFLFYTVAHRSSAVRYFLDECGADPYIFGKDLYGKLSRLSKDVSLNTKIMV